MNLKFETPFFWMRKNLKVTLIWLRNPKAALHTREPPESTPDNSAPFGGARTGPPSSLRPVAVWNEISAAFGSPKHLKKATHFDCLKTGMNLDDTSSLYRKCLRGWKSIFQYEGWNLG